MSLYNDDAIPTRGYCPKFIGGPMDGDYIPETLLPPGCMEIKVPEAVALDGFTRDGFYGTPFNYAKYRKQEDGNFHYTR